jgi:hypothetical protein
MHLAESMLCRGIIQYERDYQTICKEDDEIVSDLRKHLLAMYISSHSKSTRLP